MRSTMLKSNILLQRQSINCISCMYSLDGTSTMFEKMEKLAAFQAAKKQLFCHDKSENNNFRKFSRIKI